MEIFIVGGAVRDSLMNIEAKDYDYVIVGATKDDIDSLYAQGWKEVGKDFPVLLSPEGDEYALARTERKVGAGYHGFDFDIEDVSLEDDLMRRDLTMNAIAMNPDTKELIDPYNGQEDIENCVIRHVSDAFAEDPVRILRAARFAARYGFDIANETMELMRTMVTNGEVDALKKERVMQEFVKCVEESDTPSIFVDVLWKCGALQRIMPETETNFNPHFFDSKFEQMDNAVYNAATENRFKHFLAVFAEMFTKVEDFVALNERITFPSKAFKFAVSVRKYGTYYSEIGKPGVPAEYIVEIFGNMKIRNNGGEDFLRSVADVMIAMGYMDEERAEESFKLYNLFSSVDIAEEIERMAKAGTPLVGKEIKKRQEELQVEAITPYFA